MAAPGTSSMFRALTSPSFLLWLTMASVALPLLLILFGPAPYPRKPLGPVIALLLPALPFMLRAHAALLFSSSPSVRDRRRYAAATAGVCGLLALFAASFLASDAIGRFSNPLGFAGSSAACGLVVLGGLAFMLEASDSLAGSRRPLRGLALSVGFVVPYVFVTVSMGFPRPCSLC